MDMSNWKVTEPPTCPHCHQTMEQMDSRHLEWDSPFLWVCYNNDCGLFKRGWERMMENYGQLVSYRYMIHPQNGEASVIPAFSHQYLAAAGSVSENAPNLKDDPEFFEVD